MKMKTLYHKGLYNSVLSLGIRSPPPKVLRQEPGGRGRELRMQGVQAPLLRKHTPNPLEELCPRKSYFVGV